MTLGEKIAALRGAQKLSQGELAERLGVSRQSVSKWETDTSIPELDKLILLSDLFSIPLDALVRDQPAQEAAGEACPSTADLSRPGAQTEPPVRYGTQRILGFILLAVGLLCGTIGFALFGVLGLLGVYLALCGALCIVVKRHAALAIAWLTLLPLLALSPHFKQVIRLEAATALLAMVWFLGLLAAIRTLYLLCKYHRNV